MILPLNLMINLKQKTEKSANQVHFLPPSVKAAPSSSDAADEKSNNDENTVNASSLSKQVPNEIKLDAALKKLRNEYEEKKHELRERFGPTFGEEIKSWYDFMEFDIKDCLNQLCGIQGVFKSTQNSSQFTCWLLLNTS